MESQNNNPIKTNLSSPFNKTQRKQVIVQDSDSDWSMASLEQIKGQNLKEIVDQDHDLQLHQNNNETNTNGNIQKAKKQIKVFFPQKPYVGQASEFNPFGRIISYVGDLIIVESFPKELSNKQTNDISKIVVDLDNWLFDKNKNIIGFVMDVLGKIDHPFYVIKSQEQKKMEFPIGTDVYYVQGSKILREQDISSIMSKTAMDVENISDQSDEQNQVENLSDGQLQFDKPQQSENNHYRGRGGDQRNRRLPRKPNQDREEYSAQHYPNRHNRSRTRQHLRSRRNDRQQGQRHFQDRRRNRNDQQMNQAYLNGVYSLYHQQMMHLQYGTPLTNQNQQQNHMPIYNMPNYTIPQNFSPNTHPYPSNNPNSSRNQNFNGNQQNRPF